MVGEHCPMTHTPALSVKRKEKSRGFPAPSATASLLESTAVISWRLALGEVIHRPACSPLTPRAHRCQHGFLLLPLSQARSPMQIIPRWCHQNLQASRRLGRSGRKDNLLRGPVDLSQQRCAATASSCLLFQGRHSQQTRALGPREG